MIVLHKESENCVRYYYIILPNMLQGDFKEKVWEDCCVTAGEETAGLEQMQGDRWQTERENFAWHFDVRKQYAVIPVATT